VDGAIPEKGALRGRQEVDEREDLGLRVTLEYPRERALGGWAEALLRIAGELYLPFLVANAEAFSGGLERLQIEVWGLPYALAPFKYQVKCLEQLRGKFTALDAEDRAALKPILTRTGCWEPLAAR